MSMMNNTILNTDGYKPSHWVQYPPNTTSMYSYFESRGSVNPGIDHTIYFGMQMILKKLLSRPITLNDILQAEKFCELYGAPFNKAGWLHILDTYAGRLPVRIKSAPEGSLIPQKSVLFTVESTDPKCYWLPSYLETALVRLWYPCTVATNSFYVKRDIKEMLEKTSDPESLGSINFALHDFGYRGVSSNESAAIGGAAHLAIFTGTDTIAGIIAAMEYYNANVCGATIPASEHSTQTPFGEENEVDAYRTMVDNYTLFACVSDSWDIFKAVKDVWIGKGLIAEVEKKGGKVVIRPDSGDPLRVPVQIMEILRDAGLTTKNSKGYDALVPHVGVIQGDGINPANIRTILENMEQAGFAASNIAFGMGGGLLQQVNRDTYKFAMKCSSMTIDGVDRDVWKKPITDPTKHSKRGKVSLYRNDNGTYGSFIMGEEPEGYTEVLQVVYENGNFFNTVTFDEVRERVNSHL